MPPLDKARFFSPHNVPLWVAVGLAVVFAAVIYWPG